MSDRPMRVAIPLVDTLRETEPDLTPDQVVAICAGIEQALRSVSELARSLKYATNAEADECFQEFWRVIVESYTKGMHPVVRAETTARLVRELKPVMRRYWDLERTTP
jgi:hypothetical protein